MHISLTAVLLLVAWGSSAHADCLVRPITYGVGEELAGSSPKVALVEVSADEVPAFAAAGYSPASCNVNEPTAKIAKIDGCEMANFGNDAVQSRFTALFGVEPAKLCASARKLKGK